MDLFTILWLLAIVVYVARGLSRRRGRTVQRRAARRTVGPWPDRALESLKQQGLGDRLRRDDD